MPSAVDQAALADCDGDDVALIEGESSELRSIERIEMPLHSQQEVEREASAWATVWQSEAQPPLPLWPAIMGEAMPDLCVTAAMHACAAFPADTGLGWDNWHPRALRRISTSAKMIGIVIIALLPKAGGGTRPIGLCPSLIRVWMRLRLPVAQAWQAMNDRPYFFAGEAKGADVAAWKQAARAECSAYDGL